jgi:Spy/CpxP family protein refolding chaperone
MRVPLKIAVGFLAVMFAIPAAYAQMPGSGAPGPWHGQMGGQVQISRRVMRGPGPGMHRWGHDMMAKLVLHLVNSPMLLQRAGIGAEQADKIRQQATEFLKQQIRSRADIEIARIDLRNQMAAENPDRAAINTTLDHIGALQLAQAKAGVDFHLAMRNAFTPEQRQKLMQMLHEFMSHRRGGRQRMGPMGMKMRMRGPGPAGAPSPNPPQK